MSHDELPSLSLIREKYGPYISNPGLMHYRQRIPDVSSSFNAGQDGGDLETNLFMRGDDERAFVKKLLSRSNR